MPHAPPQHLIHTNHTALSFVVERVEIVVPAEKEQMEVSLNIISMLKQNKPLNFVPEIMETEKHIIRTIMKILMAIHQMVPEVVLGAVVRLTPDDPAAIRARMDDLMARRKASQPLEWPSAGSTFKRPEGYFAGTLIDQTGLKGLTVGGAQVSEKHAGFVINTGNATCADVQELIRRVQEAVYRAHGVRLEPEVRFVGD